MKKATKGALALILALTVTVYGCSTSWIDVAIKDLPVVVQIVTSILSIADVSAVPQAQAAGNEANNDLLVLQKYVADYKAAEDSATKQKALNDIQSALAAANNNLNNLLAVVHIKDPNKQAAVAAGVAVAMSVLVSIQSLLPGGPTSAVKNVKLANAKEVKKQFNNAIGGAYPQAVLR